MASTLRENLGDASTTGAVVAGRYRLLRTIGSGGMATVHEALDLTTSRHVAIKLLRKEVQPIAEAVSRLKREAEVLGSLAHPAIVQIETYGALPDGTVYMVMELLPGETLGARMRRGTVSPAELAPIVAGVAAGLAVAHERGVVHRDLKPDNVFLVADATEDSRSPRIKLLDFGISKVLGSDKLTQTGEVLGTPRYMAPEQLAADHIDARTDVYALGVILYEAMACASPFAAAQTTSDLLVAIVHGKVAPLSQRCPGVPPAVEAVVMRALSTSPDARFPSATAMANAFLAAVSASPDPTARSLPALMTAPMGSLALDPQPAAAGAAGFPPFAAGADERLAPGTLRGFAKTELAQPTYPSSPPAPIPPPIVDMPRASPATSVAKTRTTPRIDAWSLAETSLTGEPAPPSSLPTTRMIVIGVIAVIGLALLGGIGAWGWKKVGQGIEVTRAAPGTGTHTGTATGAGPQTGPQAKTATETATATRAGTATGPAPATDTTAATHPATAPAASSPEPDQPPARPRHPRRNNEPAAAATPTATPQAEPATPPSERTANQIMADARAALRRRDFDTCLAEIDRAIASGAPAFALRVRGDCLVGLGKTDDAVASYRRFCMLVPDHPGIGEVRALVEARGGTCP